MTAHLDAFLDEIAHRNLDDLGMIALPEPDRDARAALLASAMAAAGAAGPARLAEVRAIPDRVREFALRSFSFRGYEPSYFGLIWGRSIGRAADRARLVVAIQDAAVAAVLADDLPEDDLAALRAPFELAASMAGSSADVNPRFRSRPVAGFVAGVWLVSWAIGAGAAVAGVLAAAIAHRRPAGSGGDADEPGA
ncbi:MAG: hypothetical protein ABIZ72_01345 [Candidatus Limnocylindrales bacterium]